MASDAASGDFQAAGNSCGVYPTERQAEDFRSTGCEFHGLPGIGQLLPDTTHDFYSGMHGKLFADARKMQVYELARCMQFTCNFLVLYLSSAD